MGEATKTKLPTAHCHSIDVNLDEKGEARIELEAALYWAAKLTVVCLACLRVYSLDLATKKICQTFQPRRSIGQAWRRKSMLAQCAHVATTDNQTDDLSPSWNVKEMNDAGLLEAYLLLRAPMMHRARLQNLSERSIENKLRAICWNTW